jgi:transcriptional regulator with XRE-family HTH domain
MKLSEALSERVRALRAAAGLSQQEVAVRADLSLSQVSKLEQGTKADPRVSTLLALARALGVRPGQLIEDLPVSGTEPTARPTPRPRKKKKRPRRRKKRTR